MADKNLNSNKLVSKIPTNRERIVRNTQRAKPAQPETAQKEGADLKEIPKESRVKPLRTVSSRKLQGSTLKKDSSVAKVASSKSSRAKSGFTIRSVNGKLVVFDAEGNEVRRNDRTKKFKTGAESTKADKLETKPTLQIETAKSQSIPIEPLVFVAVKKGENLSLIASHYDSVTADDLMDANLIDDPYSLQIGQKIWIPGSVKGVCHQVKKGETISELVSRYKVPSPIQVCDLNGFSRTRNRLEPGTLIVLPGAKGDGLHEFISGSKAIRQDLSGLRGKVTWMWPLAGDFKISSPWGWRIDPYSRGKRGGVGGGGKKIRRTMHHGVDMAISTGTPVYASRAGVVVESKRQSSHGNSIKIRHADNWTTVYSHNSRLLVKKGERVEQGQLIARSGSTGRSTGPHLHFEIRRPDQKSMNPRRLLPSR